MQFGRVVGHATSTVKHATMKGWKLLVVQPVTQDNKDDGEPILVVDSLGASPAQRVMLSNDSKYLTEVIGAKNTPLRWWVMGLIDE